MKTNSISTALAVRARTMVTTRHLSFRRAWLWTGSLALATIAFGPQPAQAAVTEAWVQRYGSEAGSQDGAYKVVTDAAGNVIVAGSSGSDMLIIIKYSGAGVPQWTNRCNNSRGIWESDAGAVAVDGSGNVFVTGSSSDGGSDHAYATIKYSNVGVPLWTNRYNGLGNGYGGADAVAVDGSGNVFVTGSSVGSGGSTDYATIAYSGAGVPLWTNRYNGSGNGWDRANAVAVDGSGNVFVTGYSAGSGGYDDYATIAYSGAGVPLWTNRYNGPGNYSDSARAVAVDGSGNVFVTGSSFGTNYNYDYYTAKYAAVNGALLWEKRYNGAGNSYGRANAVAVDASGNVVVTGHSDGTDSNADYYTAKYAAADGALLWEKRYNGPANSLDIANAVAVDDSGNVVVTGRTDSSSTFGGFIGGDYYTAKYAAADGATLWEKRFSRPLSEVELNLAPSLALGPNGMIAVSGSSAGDFATVVYREVPTVSIGLVPTGVRLRFTGVPNRSYNIERAPAVTGPWSTLNTQTAPASGLFEYLDTNSPATAAFYRIVGQ